jgi:flagellar biosynthesis protein FlhF
MTPTKQETQGLRVKSYFASSFQQAMKQAQLEMGEDALLLNSRETLPEARHLGAWEVIFGTSTDSPKEKPISESSTDGDETRRNMEEIRTLLKRLAVTAPVSPRHPNSTIGQALIDAGLEQALALEIEESVRQRTSKGSDRDIGRPRTAWEIKHQNVADPIWDDAFLTMETAEVIAGRFHVQPEIGRLTALVGPPGCGKTTTLIKLAVTQGLLTGRSVRLISADTERIGAVHQLQTYAAILGVSFQAVETAAALAHAIDSAPANTITLIDTPGFSSATLTGAAGELALFLSKRQDIDTHLVLTASMRPADLKRIADAFEVFSPAKLLFTKLDETDSFAVIFNEAATRQKPLSFFTDGLLIPENLKPASKGQITDALVHRLPAALRLAA